MAYFCFILVLWPPVSCILLKSIFWRWDSGLRGSTKQQWFSDCQSKGNLRHWNESPPMQSLSGCSTQVEQGAYLLLFRSPTSYWFSIFKCDSWDSCVVVNTGITYYERLPYHWHWIKLINQIKSIKSVLTEYYLIVNIVCFKKTSIISKSSIFLSALHPVILPVPSITGYTQHMAIVYLRVSSLGYIFFLIIQ